jgi:hypothetical protein
MEKSIFTALHVSFGLFKCSDRNAFNLSHCFKKEVQNGVTAVD